MEEEKLALVSRHIVLLSYQLSRESEPQYGIILIRQGLIVQVLLVEETVEVTDLLREYRDWNPLNCEDLFISPGLIDTNAVSNERWETLEQLTKCAVSGGVTSLILEPSIHFPTSWKSSILYCDVGRVLVVDREDHFELSRDWKELAVKTYMVPPSTFVNAGAIYLKDLMSKARDFGLPLIVDVSLPSPRLLFLASPYRNTSLQDRLLATAISDPGIVAGALPDDIEPVDSSSSDGEASGTECPKKTISSVDFDDKTTRLDRPSKELSLAMMDVKVKEATNRKPYRTLNDGIASRVKTSKDDITLLSSIEQGAYLKAGPTLFIASAGSGSTNESELSFQLSPPEAKVLEIGKSCMFQDRMKRTRPSLLVIKQKVRIRQEPEENKEAMYQNHVANCPEHWETHGVEVVMAALKGLPPDGPQCKVHFSNLSSAAAISKFLSLKGNSHITCETCAHYLYFSMEQIDNGNTRFKTFPPIRNKTNTNLLWDLLKMEAISQVTSHHSTIPKELKMPGSGSFRRALNGINGLGFTLQALWSRLRHPYAHSFHHYIVRLSKWLSSNPAKLLGISHIKGSIAPGLHADLVIWDPNERFQAASESRYAEMSPYEGKFMYGKVHKVVVRGRVAFDEGEFHVCGQHLVK